VPVAALPYAPQRPGNRPAVESLVWGLLLFIPFLAGVMAIRRGRAGLKVAEDVGGTGAGIARVGMILGVLSLTLSTFVAVSVVPLTLARQRQARTVACMSQMRQLAVAAMMYAQSNAGAVAPDIDALAPMLAPRFGQLCTCPEAAHGGVAPVATLKSGTACSYVYVPPPPAVTVFAQLPNPAMTVMAFEPLANHKGRGFNAVYWDGHVEWHSGAGAAALAATLNAQVAANTAARQNAPPPATAPAAPAAPR
jgi:prepilin-type processing-associated H-X9-DG protein